ncbi:MAG TPA: L-rhamnose/proton symporter RhaT [Candidatus Didemnitutus sp.]|nr:L-rhamnose/proton symporter RhaT [Candidatus Didemnitutus sp.]
MNPNPFLGVVFHWLGGLASGSFYVPFKGVRRWSWETYWMTGGFFSWVVCPWILAALLTRDLPGVLSHQSAATLGWTMLFGALWGFGGLTYGLTMRYLGMSLGTGVALGFCAAFGTLLPPIFKSFVPSVPVPETLREIAASTPGQITLAGVAVCFLGIGIAALAGLTKEREMPAEQKKAAIAEFNFTKGILVATFCGIMSACFAFALTAGNPIGEASVAAGTSRLWSGLPKLCVVLVGGAATNFVWCGILHARNRTGHQYFSGEIKDGPGQPPPGPNGERNVPLLANYLFSALAGTTWYLQFFFYTMGETQMGEFRFASWTLHMASIIIFATMWGWLLHEWRGSSRKAHRLIGMGVAALVLSTVIIGVGTWFKSRS